MLSYINTYKKEKQHNFMLPWSVSLMSGIGNCFILVVIFYDFPFNLLLLRLYVCCFWHYIILVRIWSLLCFSCWCPWISFTYNTFIFMEMKSYFNNPTSRNEVFRKICVQEQIIKIKVEKYSNYLKLMEISMVPRTFTPTSSSSLSLWIQHKI